MYDRIEAGTRYRIETLKPDGLTEVRSNLYAAITFRIPPSEDTVFVIERMPEND